MIRKLAFYAWLLLIAVLLIYNLFSGYIISTFFSTQLPPSLPPSIMWSFWIAFGALALLNFYFLFHRPQSRDARRRLEEKRRNGR